MKKSKRKYVRYDEKTINSIIAFLKKGKTNVEAKKQFGCTAHYAGKLRKKAKLKAAPAPKKAKSAKKSAASNNLL